MRILDPTNMLFIVHHITLVGHPAFHHAGLNDRRAVFHRECPRLASRRNNIASPPGAASRQELALTEVLPQAFDAILVQCT